MKKPLSFEGQAGRRNLLASLGSLTLLALLTRKFTGGGRNRRLFDTKHKPLDCGPGAAKTAKMLTSDGRLVEVDLNVTSAVKKASMEEVRDWITHNNL